MDYTIKSETLTKISDAIRDKTGTIEQLSTTQMVDKINSLYSLEDFYNSLNR